MKKFVSLLVAASMATIVPLPTMTASAQAYPYGSASCVAKSPSAIGQGLAWTMDNACARALYECSIRTPTYETCYVTNRWYN